MISVDSIGPGLNTFELTSRPIGPYDENPKSPTPGSSQSSSAQKLETAVVARLAELPARAANFPRAALCARPDFVVRDMRKGKGRSEHMWIRGSNTHVNIHDFPSTLFLRCSLVSLACHTAHVVVAALAGCREFFFVKQR